MTCLEICAGPGGQPLGLEQAGISHAATVEIDHDACQTLRLNRQHAWKVIEADVRHFDGRPTAVLRAIRLERLATLAYREHGHGCPLPHACDRSVSDLPGAVAATPRSAGRRHVK